MVVGVVEDMAVDKGVDMEDKDNRNCNQLQLVEHTQKFFLTNLTLYFTSLNEFI